MIQAIMGILFLFLAVVAIVDHLRVRRQGHQGDGR